MEEHEVVLMAKVIKERNSYKHIVDIISETLRFYASGQHIWNESEKGINNICPPIGHHAQRALDEANRILKEIRND